MKTNKKLITLGILLFLLSPTVASVASTSSSGKQSTMPEATLASALVNKSDAINLLGESLKVDSGNSGWTHNTPTSTSNNTVLEKSLGKCYYLITQDLNKGINLKSFVGSNFSSLIRTGNNVNRTSIVSKVTQITGDARKAIANMVTPEACVSKIYGKNVVNVFLGDGFKAKGAPTIKTINNLNLPSYAKAYEIDLPGFYSNSGVYLNLYSKTLLIYTGKGHLLTLYVVASLDDVYFKEDKGYNVLISKLGKLISQKMK